MTPSGIAHDIRNLTSWMMEKSIAQFTQPFREVRGHGAIRLCAQGAKAAVFPVASCLFGTIDEYRAYVNNEAYSAILGDGSLIHLSYDFHGQTLTSHRLIYYPCPIAFDSEYADEPILDLLDYYSSQPASIRLRTPLRFDYSIVQDLEDHSCSHLHMQTDACRLPVLGPLSVGRFVQIVFRNFYPHLWVEHEYLREFRCHPISRTINRHESITPHLAFGGALSGHA